MSCSHAVMGLLKLQALQICKVLGCLLFQFFFTWLDNLNTWSVPKEVCQRH